MFFCLFQRALCCFPGFTNPIAAPRKGKLPKPLLVSGGGGGGTGSRETSPNTPPSYDANAILLLEKQGRASQQQRHPLAAPPSSLPRPPRPHRSGLPRRLADYNRLEGESTPTRKKSDESLSSTGSRRMSPTTVAMVTGRKLGEYGRLSESGGSSSSLRKQPSMQRSRSGGERNSASTLSDQSASSLPAPSKIRLFGSGSGGNGGRRGGSLGRESKSSTDSNGSKYRIQF